jgi:RNA polymerase sigma factor (sigma-70 family)
MNESQEHRFAEILFEQFTLENLPDFQSAYYQTEDEIQRLARFRKALSKLRWHIRHSLAGRQREVIELILAGKTEREIASLLGVTQQVVHIYKQRAINKLRSRF